VRTQKTLASAHINAGEVQETIVTIPCATIEDEIRDLCLQLLAAQNEQAWLRVIPELRYALGV